MDSILRIPNQFPEGSGETDFADGNRIEMKKKGVKHRNIYGKVRNLTDLGKRPL